MLITELQCRTVTEMVCCYCYATLTTEHKLFPPCYLGSAIEWVLKQNPGLIFTLPCPLPNGAKCRMAVKPIFH